MSRIRHSLGTFDSNHLDSQGMDLLFHEFAQCFINHPMLLKTALAVEGRGRDHEGEMAAAAPGTGVSGVLIAFIDHLKEGGGEGFPEAEPDFAESCFGHGGRLCQTKCQDSDPMHGCQAI